MLREQFKAHEKTTMCVTQLQRNNSNNNKSGQCCRADRTGGLVGLTTVGKLQTEFSVFFSKWRIWAFYILLFLFFKSGASSLHKGNETLMSLHVWNRYTHFQNVIFNVSWFSRKWCFFFFPFIILFLFLFFMYRDCRGIDMQTLTISHSCQ